MKNSGEQRDKDSSGAGKSADMAKGKCGQKDSKKK